MGMSAGLFNTREFFHHAWRAAMKRVRLLSFGLGFALQALAAAWAIAAGSGWLWAVALLLQLPVLVAYRWLFFAQANHSQNLYYQVVS